MLSAIQGRGVAQGSTVADHAISPRSVGARRLWLPGRRVADKDGGQQKSHVTTPKIGKTSNMLNSKPSEPSKQQEHIGGPPFLFPPAFLRLQ
jgi:hypothetical protein